MKTLESFVKEQYSPKSAPGYLSTIKRYLNYAGETVVKASYTDILNYIAHLRSLELHPKSLVGHLFCIKIYYRWLNATNQRDDHPCQHLVLQDRLNKRIPVETLYSQEVLIEFLKKHQNKRKYMQRRDEVIITFLIYQAMNVQEIGAINVEDVNLVEATIKAKGGLKQKSRTLPLNASQILLLHQYIFEDRPKLLQNNKLLNYNDENALVLSNVGTRVYAGNINRIINMGRANHEKLIPYKIRQSVIAHLLKQKNDVRIVQVFAGHRRVGSTEEYKLTGLEELKEVIQRLHPLEAIAQGQQMKQANALANSQ